MSYFLYFFFSVYIFIQPPLPFPQAGRDIRLISKWSTVGFS